MAEEEAENKSQNGETNKLDINNQMVLMRKNIKKAKGHVVAKLLRKAKLLKSKKTKTEDQAKKNQQRADRLLKEIKLLKAANPDVIFKQIVVSDWTEEDFMKRSDVPLKYRAHMRIAVVPFIKKKLEPVKTQIRKYDEERGKTKTLSYTDITKELEKPDVEAADDEKIFKNVKKLAKKVEKEEVRSAPPVPTSEGDDDDEEDVEIEEESSDEEVETQMDDDTDLLIFNPPTVVDIDSLSEEEEDKVATKIVDTQVVAATKQVTEKAKKVKPKTSQPPPPPVVKPLLSEIVKESKTDDVSFFLENLGQGFRDSDDEGDSSDGVDLLDDDVDDDDVTEQEVVKREGFFMGEDDASNKADEKKAKQGGKKQSKSEMKSTFIRLKEAAKQSAADNNNNQLDAQGKRKKKNRPGQRTRQMILGGIVDTKRTDRRNVKRKGRFDETISKHGAKQSKKSETAATTEEVHPSWQASQMKKQQCSIQKFEGKRIVFDDSD